MKWKLHKMARLSAKVLVQSWHIPVAASFFARLRAPLIHTYVHNSGLHTCVTLHTSIATTTSATSWRSTFTCNSLSPQCSKRWHFLLPCPAETFYAEDGSTFGMFFCDFIKTHFLFSWLQEILASWEAYIYRNFVANAISCTYTPCNKVWYGWIELKREVKRKSEEEKSEEDVETAELKFWNQW